MRGRNSSLFQHVRKIMAKSNNRRTRIIEEGRRTRTSKDPGHPTSSSIRPAEVAANLQALTRQDPAPQRPEVEVDDGLEI